MVFLLVAAAVVVGTPIAAAVLVTIASLHEDSGHTLGGRAPGPIAAAARHLLCVRTGGIADRRRPETRPGSGHFAGRSASGFAPDDLSASIPRPRPAADGEAADHTLTLPRA